jgi:putative transcriptional regulator
MAKSTKTKQQPRGRARMRAQIVEAMRGLHRLGAVSNEEVEKTTLKMLSKDTLPRVKELSPAEIAALRERAGVSQGVLAAFMNVAVSTISQWERGERRPTGAALKLLHVVRHKGIEALQ